MLAFAKTGYGGGKNQRVQGRRLQLIAHEPVNRLGLQKMIGVDRLRRAAPGLHFLLKNAGGHDHRVQERPASKAAMRVGRTGTQQHRRGVDGAACQHIVFCYYFYS